MAVVGSQTNQVVTIITGMSSRKNCLFSDALQRVNENPESFHRLKTATHNTA
jgi:hypothetical protein